MKATNINLLLIFEVKLGDLQSTHFFLMGPQMQSKLSWQSFYYCYGPKIILLAWLRRQHTNNISQFINDFVFNLKAV